MSELPLRVAIRVGDALDRLGVRWVVAGSLAVVLHGTVRDVPEVRLVADLAAAHVDPLLADLSRGFFVDRRAAALGVQNRSWFRILHLDSRVPVDLVLARDDLLARNRIARRVNFRVYESEAIVPVLSAEDTILEALEAWRRSGREAHRDDAVDVLRACGRTLHGVYLKRAARQAKLTRLLEAARALAADDAAPGGPADGARRLSS